MASVTSNPSATGPLANRLPGALTLRIEPPRGWSELRLQELCSYRELLFFLVWRDVKVRCRRRSWVIMRLLTMLVATLIFGRLAKLRSQGLPYSVFRFAAPVPWTYFSRLFASVGIVILLAFGRLLFSNHMEGSIADRV
jgi:lipopolysaccharide transport system permease protein